MRRSTALWLLLSVALASPAGGQEPGARYEVRPEDMPPPYATPSAGNRPRSVDRPAGLLPKVPAGFEVNVFAADLRHARNMVVAANGDVLLAESRADRVTLLRDADGDGRAELVGTFLDDLDRPYGLAIQPGALYVADTDGVWRVDYKPGDVKVWGKPKRITPRGALGGSGGHWTRNLVFSPDGTRFFVAVGSRGNIDEEDEPRATVQVFDRDGSGGRTFAAGLRNPVGIAVYPDSDDLYVVVNERDGLGDELVPDYLTRIGDGAFFGWPYAYIGSNPQPKFAERRPDLVERSRLPDLLFRSHTAPLGLVFYDAAQFPEDYRGDAFVALHGSWNAARARGYMVVRVPFAEGRPQGHYEAFMTGFRLGDPAEGEEGRARVWGRPAGVAVAADGSLLVADDASQTIWRVSYRR
jgi:glucose/arabinose dehydrogenase